MKSGLMKIGISSLLCASIFVLLHDRSARPEAGSRVARSDPCPAFFIGLKPDPLRHDHAAVALKPAFHAVSAISYSRKTGDAAGVSFPSMHRHACRIDSFERASEQLLHAYRSDLFPVCKELRPTVRFWMRIYAGVSSSAGLLHDREYPYIIFETIRLDGMSRREASRHIERRKTAIRSSLHTILTQPHWLWSEREHRILRMYEKYAPMGALDKAAKRLRFQRGMRETFAAGVARSFQHIRNIRRILRSHGVPEELAYLPHVESSFNVNARSHCGAAGMWQFMRATGRRFLHIGYRIDERYDPEQSTIAAARLLRGNFELLGSWPLAVTGYNHGPYGVRRAVRRTGTTDLARIIKKYRGSSFGFASRNFYCSFIAASLVAGHYYRFYGHIIPENRQLVTRLKLNERLTPAMLARRLSISEEELSELNPALRSCVFTRQLWLPRAYPINVPYHVEYAEVVDAEAFAG